MEVWTATCSFSFFFLLLKQHNSKQREYKCLHITRGRSRQLQECRKRLWGMNQVLFDFFANVDLLKTALLLLLLLLWLVRVQQISNINRHDDPNQEWYYYCGAFSASQSCSSNITTPGKTSLSGRREDMLAVCVCVTDVLLRAWCHEQMVSIWHFSFCTEILIWHSW